MRLLEGEPLAKRLQAELSGQAQVLASGGDQPRLAVLLAGDDPGSRWYAQAKAKLGARLGIDVLVEKVPGDATTEALTALLERWNAEPTVHGILVELPLPPQVATATVLAGIAPHKDVDCVCPTNRGRLFAGDEVGLLLPATPQSCIELLESVPCELSGARAVVVGRGETVGRPLAAMLVSRHCTVTICHTRTQNLADVTRQADLLMVAAGRTGLVTAELVGPDMVVVDAGINEVDDALVGDVDFDAVAPIVRAITPVPGGVGTLTTSIIMRNVLQAARQQRETN